MKEFLVYYFSVPITIFCVNALLFIVLAIKTKKKAHFILMIYLLTILGIQSFAIWLAFHGNYNLYVSHYYFIFQLLILGYFYYTICTIAIQKKLIKYSIVGCILILGIQYAITPEIYSKFNNLEIFLTSYLLIIYSLIHFYNLLSAKKTFLFLNIGVFLYLFGSTVLFLMGNLSAIIDITVNFDINNILFIVFHVFIFMEWVQLYFNKKSSKLKNPIHGI